MSDLSPEQVSATLLAVKSWLEAQAKYGARKADKAQAHLALALVGAQERRIAAYIDLMIRLKDHMERMGFCTREEEPYLEELEQAITDGNAAMSEPLSNDQLLPCPFCRAGETFVQPNHYWTGMKNIVLSVEVKHWCQNRMTGVQGSMIVMRAKTEQEARERWNKRI